jgi:hypothetical protein
MKPVAATAIPNRKKTKKATCVQRLIEIREKHPALLKAKNGEDINRGNTSHLLRVEIPA